MSLHTASFSFQGIAFAEREGVAEEEGYMLGMMYGNTSHNIYKIVFSVHLHDDTGTEHCVSTIEDEDRDIYMFT